MTEPSPSSIPAAQGEGVRWLVALLAIGVVAAILAVPLLLIRGLVLERMDRGARAQAEAAGMWGGRQTVAGPILVIPYRSKTGILTDVSEGFVAILPETLEASARIQPESRSKGLFDILLYRAEITLDGEFAAPDWKTLGIAPEDLVWEDAILTVRVEHAIGLHQAAIRWGDAVGEVEPEPRLDGTRGAVQASLDGLSAEALAEGRSFSVSLMLAGSDALLIEPVGDRSVMRMAGDWPHPDFTGWSLPVDRSVTEDGFEARWERSALARGYPSAWRDADFGSVGRASAAGVAFARPGEAYQQMDRLMKFAVLLVGLVFATIFIAGAVTKRSFVHPVQYLMVGASLALFFLLTLALAEHIGFAAAYSAASAVDIAIVGAYLARTVERWNGLATAIILAAAHGFMFVLLQSERFALLAGAAGLLIGLIAAMAATRNLDWHRLAPVGRTGTSGTSGGRG